MTYITYVDWFDENGELQSVESDFDDLPSALDYIDNIERHGGVIWAYDIFDDDEGEDITYRMNE